MVSFFKATTQATPKEQDSIVINVGGEQFHAAAVAVINYFQHNSSFNEATAKIFLKRLYQYFDKFVDQQPYLKVSERMERLLESSSKSKLVDAVAYTLRELAIDKILADPLNLQYRSIFDSFAADTSIKILRDPRTKLPESASQALAQVLGLSLTLSYTEPDKPIRARQGHLGDIPAALEIQIEGDKFYPEVKREEDFAHVGQLAVSVKPKVIQEEQEGDLAHVLSQIAADNKEIVRCYEQWRTKLLTMIAAKEVNYEQLRDCYIALLPDDFQTPAVVRKIAQSGHPATAVTPVGSENLLINTLASMMVTGAINEDDLFARLEKTQARARAVSMGAG